jgi:hypothetical protein
MTTDQWVALAAFTFLLGMLVDWWWQEEQAEKRVKWLERQHGTRRLRFTYDEGGDE